MKIQNIPTDDTMRSLLIHGSTEFPFEYYLDEIDQFHEKSIAWHWHKEVEFSLILSGTVRCCDEQNSYRLAVGDGLFINSGTLHRFESEDSGVMVNMVFAPELIAQPGSLLFTEYVEKIITSGYPLLVFRKACCKDQQVLEYIAQLYKTTDKSPFSVRNAALRLWEALLDFIGDEFPQERKGDNKLLRARIQKMVQFIHENYPARIRLTEIAQAANISVSEALRCFRVSAQTTPISYLNDYRLTRAKELLVSTHDPVISIAAAVGFVNPSYFCRSFKKKYSISPSLYRKR